MWDVYAIERRFERVYVVHVLWCSLDFFKITWVSQEYVAISCQLDTGIDIVVQGQAAG